MGCNWSKLLGQNRCKAIGVPWNDMELNAIYQLKIPADFVRNGCLSLESYKEAKDTLDECEAKGKEKPLFYMSKVELLEKAEKMKLNLTEEVGRSDLIQLISQSELPIKEEVVEVKVKKEKKIKKTK